jgi:phosphate transport system substrate-binding protein
VTRLLSPFAGRMRSYRWRRFALRAPVVGPVFAFAIAVSLLAAAVPAEADSTAANGQGSSYVGIAMQQWISQAQTQAIPVNYTATNSPAGLNAFAQNTADFAGTEAEFSSLGETNNVTRGWQYTPDVAGATAIMYNVDTQAGQPVTYLHLSPMTIAEIFMGEISNWDSPQITADNHGLVLANEPITVVYRTGQSGTTALFYDFIHQTDPSYYAQWAQSCQYPAYPTRIIQLDTCPSFVPHSEGFSGSDQQAEFVASAAGLGSIGYDEFAYPKQYGAQVAWVENASGNWVQPYATNIAAALQSATLNADLSQNLDNVYTSTNPLTYPISAYSYIVTQCDNPSSASYPDGQYCKGAYSNSGLSQTLGDFMSYIACSGQVDMAELGYSPLPTVLSQDMVDAVARLTGASSTEQLSSSNCDNPTFSGSLGAEATNPNQDPYAGCGPNAFAPGGGGCAGQSAPTTTTTTLATTTTAAAVTTTSTTSASGVKTTTSTPPTTAAPGGPVGPGSPTGTTVAGARPGTTVAGSQPGTTEAPTSWLPTSALGSPVSATMRSASLDVSASYEGASASVAIPAGALPAGTTVTLYPVSSPSAIAQDVPARESYVTSFAVLWETPTGTAPGAAAPATITINDAAIAAGASVTDVTPSGLSVLGTVPRAGAIALRFSGVSLFVIAQAGGPSVAPTTTLAPGPSTATNRPSTTLPARSTVTAASSRATPTTSAAGTTPGSPPSTAPQHGVTPTTATPGSPPATASLHGVTPTTASSASGPATAPAGVTPTTAQPDITPATAAAPGVTPATAAVPGVTPATAAVPGVTPATAAVPGVTPATAAVPGVTPATAGVPGVTPPTAAGLDPSTPTTSSAVAGALPPTATTDVWRNAAPVAYNRPVPGGISAVPLVVLLSLIAVPVLAGSVSAVWRSSRLRRTPGDSPGGMQEPR